MHVYKPSKPSNPLPLTLEKREGEKEEIGIWPLLVWTYRAQAVPVKALAQGQAGGVFYSEERSPYGADSVQRVARAGALGYVSLGSLEFVGADHKAPADAWAVARWCETLPGSLSGLVARSAQSGRPPAQADWPEAPMLRPSLGYRGLRHGLRMARAVTQGGRPHHTPLRIEPALGAFFEAADVYRRWWQALEQLRTLIAFEEWELHRWRLSAAMPPEPLPAPLWAQGWKNATTLDPAV